MNIQNLFFKDSTIYFFGKDSIKIFKDISALKQEIYRIHSESIKSTPNKMIKFTVLYNPILFEISQEEKSKVILSILSTINSSLAKELADSIVNKINENSQLKLYLPIKSKISNYTMKKKQFMI
jgi:hypothetical protein